MRNILCALVLASCCVLSYGQVSPKRGMAYGYHSEADLDRVKEGISWWYNWSDSPDNAIKDYYSSQGVEFVPMLWNDDYNVADVIARIPDDAKYLLAYNEPNFNVEARMTPAEAAAAWYRVEQVAAAKNLQIVSAAAAYCGGGACYENYTSPIAWHDDFFAACPDCKVDYIAFHNYEPTVEGLVYLVNTLKKYNLPIWVTEFAYWDNDTEANKINYLERAVSSFENDPDVFRYSWFTGRSTANPSISLLGADGLLKPLGEAYIDAPYGPQHNIPGKIEAESMYRRKGTGIETTLDDGAGANIGFTDAGTWTEYLVNISTTGAYTFRFRIASDVSTGKFNIKLDDQLIHSNVSVMSTGGWQAWQDHEVSGIVLTSGQHLLKFEFTETGTNMNYFTTTYEGVVAPKADFSASTITSCTGSQVLFTNQSSQTLGTETYLWNFGAGANPATANTAGPHTVVYSSVGQKSISLQVTNANGTDTETKINYVSIAPLPTSCLWSDDFDNHTVNWIAPVPGAFTHEETGTTWSIANNGYGEWQNFIYTLNDGSVGTPINFQCTANKPILKIRAKASANCLLRASLMDVNGRVVDNINAIDLELTPAYQTFTINFAGRFRNYNSGNPGILDSSNITRVQFYINPGYFSYPITGANANYNSAFNGIVDIDWIGIGDNCSPPLITDIVSYESRGYSVMPNPFVDETIVNLDAFNGEKATIKVMDSQGRIVYTREDQSTTAPFKWGKEFPVGLYVMTAVNDQKAITFSVIKAK